MATDHRYHLDQNGHSITVVHHVRRRRAEALVDGKVVASARSVRHAPVLLRGEVATDPPSPFLIRIGHPDAPGDVPLCVLEKDGLRYLMPYTPLTRREDWPTEQPPTARTPAELVTRWMDRYRHHRDERRRPGR